MPFWACGSPNYIEMYNQKNNLLPRLLLLLCLQQLSARDMLGPMSGIVNETHSFGKTKTY